MRNTRGKHPHWSASESHCTRLRMGSPLLARPGWPGMFLLLVLVLGLAAATEQTDDSSKSMVTSLEGLDAHAAAQFVADQLEFPGLTPRVEAIFQNTHTAECRALLADHLRTFTQSLIREEGMPFADFPLKGDCPEPFYDWDNLPPDIEHIGKIQNRTYQPPRNETEYIDDPRDLNILYAILTHETSESTIRLVETLYEPGHTFIIHVDGKPASDDAFRALQAYAMDRPYVHVMAHRLRINWGGYTMVEAMLDMLKYALNLPNDSLYYSRQRDPIPFHKVVHMSSTSYPIASKESIRRKIAEFPLDANFLQVVMKPMRPGPNIWSYFVECDDWLHRIHRLPPLTNLTHGAELFTASQWFIISREFATYIAEAKKGSFVQRYLIYLKHVVVADETFLGTVIRNTRFCLKHHNRNFLHLQFDRWESDLPSTVRDPRKCPLKDPNHCGRSPTTMTIDYADILELSDDLFARKFLEDDPARVKDMVDGWTGQRESRFQEHICNIENDGGANTSAHNRAEYTGQPAMRFEGHGVLLVAKESLHTGNASDAPLCLGLGPTGNHLRLVECFHRAVVPTLAENWYTGAVILEETLAHNRWELDPCTSDGTMERLPTAEVRTTPGEYSQTGPRCMLKIMDGIRAGRCFDGDSGTSQPGGEVQVFPCMHRWVQFLSVGDGRLTPPGSLYYTIPAHIVKQIENGGHPHIPHMCLGVWGRGVADEVEWDDPMANEPDDPEPAEWPPLSNYVNDDLFSTQCTNKGAVLEWLFVPFIVEEDEEELADDESVDNAAAEAKSDEAEQQGSEL